MTVTFADRNKKNAWLIWYYNECSFISDANMWKRQNLHAYDIR